MRLTFLISIIFFCSGAFAQGEAPISVSVCDLKANPAAFNKKLIKVQGRISMGFEDFLLHDSRCPDFAQSPWLMYGGDASDDVVYCCGSHDKLANHDLIVEGFKIGLKKDVNFTSLASLLNAYRRPSGFSTTKRDTATQEYLGSYYEVTATLVGRFFSGRKITYPGGTFYSGYGHMGCCTLFVIQEVASIDNTKSNAAPGDLKCSASFWRESEDKHYLQELQNKTSVAERWKAGDPQLVANATLGERMVQWNDSAHGTFLGKCNVEKWWDHQASADQYSASCKWVSDDGLDSYSIDLRKYGFLKKIFKSWDEVIWIPVWVQRSSCIRE